MRLSRTATISCQETTPPQSVSPGSTRIIVSFYQTTDVSNPCDRLPRINVNEMQCGQHHCSAHADWSNLSAARRGSPNKKQEQVIIISASGNATYEKRTSWGRHGFNKNRSIGLVKHSNANLFQSHARKVTVHPPFLQTRGAGVSTDNPISDFIGEVEYIYT